MAYVAIVKVLACRHQCLWYYPGMFCPSSSQRLLFLEDTHPEEEEVEWGPDPRQVAGSGYLQTMFSFAGRLEFQRLCLTA